MDDRIDAVERARGRCIEWLRQIEPNDPVTSGFERRAALGVPANAKRRRAQCRQPRHDMRAEEAAGAGDEHASHGQASSAMPPNDTPAEVPRNSTLAPGTMRPFAARDIEREGDGSGDLVAVARRDVDELFPGKAGLARHVGERERACLVRHDEVDIVMPPAGAIEQFGDETVEMA